MRHLVIILLSTSLAALSCAQIPQQQHGSAGAPDAAASKKQEVHFWGNQTRHQVGVGGLKQHHASNQNLLSSPQQQGVRGESQVQDHQVEKQEQQLEQEFEKKRGKPASVTEEDAASVALAPNPTPAVSEILYTSSRMTSCQAYSTLDSKNSRDFDACSAPVGDLVKPDSSALTYTEMACLAVYTNLVLLCPEGSSSSPSSQRRPLQLSDRVEVGDDVDTFCSALVSRLPKLDCARKDAAPISELGEDGCAAYEGATAALGSDSAACRKECSSSGSTTNVTSVCRHLLHSSVTLAKNYRVIPQVEKEEEEQGSTQAGGEKGKVKTTEADADAPKTAEEEEETEDQKEEQQKSEERQSSPQQQKEKTEAAPSSAPEEEEKTAAVAAAETTTAAAPTAEKEDHGDHTAAVAAAEDDGRDDDSAAKGVDDDKEATDPANTTTLNAAVSAVPGMMSSEKDDDVAAAAAVGGGQDVGQQQPQIKTSGDDVAADFDNFDQDQGSAAAADDDALSSSKVAYGKIDEHMGGFKPGTVGVGGLGGDADADGGGGVFSYLVLMGIVGIAFYLVFHNKQKILALILEGRRGRPSRGRSGSGSGGRHRSAQYRKLDNNLEEAMEGRSGGQGSADSMRQIIY